MTATDANGCAINTAFSITQPAALVSNASQTNVSCNGDADGTITLTTSGGTSPYSYDAGAGSVAGNVISGLAAGAYDVTVTDENDCVVIVDVTITEPDALEVSASVDNHVSCNGGSDGSATASATGGTAAYHYLWSNGSTDETATGLAAGVHSVQVTDENGCVDDVTVEITEPSDICFE